MLEWIEQYAACQLAPMLTRPANLFVRIREFPRSSCEFLTSGNGSSEGVSEMLGGQHANDIVYGAWHTPKSVFLTGTAHQYTKQQSIVEERNKDVPIRTAQATGRSISSFIRASPDSWGA